MDIAEIRSTVLATLKTIAPEVEENTLKHDQPLRAQIDLDSMDWLNAVSYTHLTLPTILRV